MRKACATASLISIAQADEKPSAHTKGTPTGKPTGPMKPGEYWWRPQLSPERAAHRAGQRAEAGHACVSQWHPHRALDREHRFDGHGPRRAGRRLLFRAYL